MSRSTLQPPDLFQSKRHGFSQVVISEPGRTVHVAGQVAWDADERIVGDTLDAQFHKALDNVVTAVQAAGGTADDIKSMVLFIPGFEPERDGEAIARVLTDRFGTENPPAASWIGVHSLASKDFLIEVEAVAIL